MSAFSSDQRMLSPASMPRTGNDFTKNSKVATAAAQAEREAQAAARAMAKKAEADSMLDQTENQSDDLSKNKRKEDQKKPHGLQRALKWLSKAKR